MGASHNQSFHSPDLLVKTRHTRRGFVWNDIAPELRPKANDEVHSSRGGSWFPDRGDDRGEFLRFLRVQNVKLQVRMRGGSESEDASLGCVHHAGIIDWRPRVPEPG
jgi:hypothetical protein